MLLEFSLIGILLEICGFLLLFGGNYFLALSEIVNFIKEVALYFNQLEIAESSEKLILLLNIPSALYKAFKLIHHLFRIISNYVIRGLSFLKKVFIKLLVNIYILIFFVIKFSKLSAEAIRQLGKVIKLLGENMKVWIFSLFSTVMKTERRHSITILQNRVAPNRMVANNRPQWRY